MSVHISLRLAWHDDGWNGHVCKNPKANTHCVGQHSYPGSLINESRNLEWESKEDVAGCHCSQIDGIPPCSYSINAFGISDIRGESNPPDFFNDDSKGVTFDIPAATACIWPYEQMYSDDVKRPKGSTQTYNYDKRLQNGKDFFKVLEPNNSLIFYYANKSNPFSEEDSRNFALIGISRLKKTGDIMFYDNVSEANRLKYANGFVWQVPITSHFPDEGFTIPYHKYRDQPEILEKITYIPEIPSNFKYGTKHISDDDALIYVERLTEIVDYLISIDDSENWEARKAWLISLQNELWKNRGPFPGLPSILEVLDMPDLVMYYKSQVLLNNGIEATETIFKHIKDLKIKTYEGDVIAPEILRSYQGNWFKKLDSEDKRELAEKILSRIDLKPDQVRAILSDRREENSIYNSLKEIIDNPFILSEDYIGNDIDDVINFEKIDHAVMPSPEIELEKIIAKDDGRRLRALMVDNLKHTDVHAFVDQTSILDAVNTKLNNYPGWKKEIFNTGFIDFERELFEDKLLFKNHKDITYIYLKEIFNQERIIEKQVRNLVGRLPIEIKRPFSEEKWKNEIHRSGCELDSKASEEYAEAVEGQKKVCMQIFQKPISVLSGAAGTGKTTVINAIIKAIKTTSNNTEKCLLLAPTGKASDRMREATGEDAKTIHRFLASKGWLNNNFTFKREGGKREEDITTYIIDETSMIDLTLMATLFKAINWDYAKRVIFVGDPNQLPPIGKGKVFADVIEFIQSIDPEAYGFLKFNMRQMENRVDGKGTGIIDLASMYVQNINGESKNKSDFEDILNRINEEGCLDEDVKVFVWEDDEKLEEQLVSELQTDMVGSGNDDIMEYQVISPYRGELFGTENLNKLLQGTLNEKNLNRGTLGGVTYFDKVIQFTNRAGRKGYWAYSFDKKRSEKIDVFNGELGKTWAKKFGYYKVKFNTTFNRLPNYSVGFSSDSQVEENIELGYAISVHKSQGSEFSYLYLVIPQSKQALLSTELIYTGITRAKTKLRVFVEKDLSILQSLRRPERSKLNFINSSLFKFEPLPLEFSNMGSWYEEGKIHKTLSEYLVRSKSEVIITNLLVSNDVESFKYETLLTAPDGTFYLPDFTINVNGKTYYWEHVGMLHLPKYKERWELKQKWYDKHFPNQLLITYESENLTIEAQQIIDEIKTI
ncbi:AAA family ATPase [uncultured Psychroserpens sp.]|uniref:AAA family ATPase n=1 Tax=uncultured Psychroserpens sp. TaxID=255436 RepID=UPI00262524AF|nr:AAA family ATPase [uncultured Psychroserpens sp.]